MAVRILIMGPPGSGKGTQAAILAEAQGIAHVSTGDMLRAAMVAESPLGLQVKEIVECGDLVPDGLMLELVRERLSQPDTSKDGVLLDGFPRTVAQAEALLAAMAADGTPLDCVILLEVPDGLLVERALARGRKDDTEETIRHRLSVYRAQTQPVLEYLDGKLPIYIVDGVGSVEEITERIASVLDAEH